MRATRVAHAFVLLTFYGLLLRVWPQRVLRHATRSFESPIGAVDRRDAKLDTVLSAVERAAQFHPWRPQCLERALVARALLSCGGTRARVVLGVSRSAEGLAAHAWVDVDGHTNDASRAAFVTLAELR